MLYIYIYIYIFFVVDVHNIVCICLILQCKSYIYWTILQYKVINKFNKLMYELVGLYSVDLRIRLIIKLTKKQVNNMQEVRRSRTSFSISCGVKALSKKIKKSQKFTTTSPLSGTQSFQISLLSLLLLSSSSNPSFLS